MGDLTTDNNALSFSCEDMIEELEDGKKSKRLNESDDEKGSNDRL